MNTSQGKGEKKHGAQSSEHRAKKEKVGGELGAHPSLKLRMTLWVLVAGY